MKAPTQCVLWKKPKLAQRPKEEGFELVEFYVDESHWRRYLLKCRECGQLYFYEFYETIDWEDGDDPQYWTYIPVEMDAEIETLKKTSPFELLQFSPRLRSDFPKGAKAPTVYWVK